MKKKLTKLAISVGYGLLYGIIVFFLHKWLSPTENYSIISVVASAAIAAAFGYGTGSATRKVSYESETKSESSLSD